jgi:hypothetical protein
VEKKRIRKGKKRELFGRKIRRVWKKRIMVKGDDWEKKDNKKQLP